MKSTPGRSIFLTCHVWRCLPVVACFRQRRPSHNFLYYSLVSSAVVCLQICWSIMEEAAWVECTEADFLKIGCRVWRAFGDYREPSLVDWHRYREHFGCSPYLCCLLWDLLHEQQLMTVLGATARPEHILWTLLFLKQYATEAPSAGCFGCNEQTYRKWIWRIVELISQKTLVSISCCLCFRNCKSNYPLFHAFVLPF